MIHPLRGLKEPIFALPRRVQLRGLLCQIMQLPISINGTLTAPRCLQVRAVPSSMAPFRSSIKVPPPSQYSIHAQLLVAKTKKMAILSETIPQRLAP